MYMPGPTSGWGRVPHTTITHTTHHAPHRPTSKPHATPHQMANTHTNAISDDGAYTYRTLEGRTRIPQHLPLRHGGQIRLPL